MIAALAVARRGLLRGDSSCGIALLRGVQTGLQRLQAPAEHSASQADGAQETESRKDFSFFPPVPGKGSTLRWEGRKYEEIPVAHIKATYNNTHIHVVSCQNIPLTLVTCGTEGFKKAKKGTAIAAQTAGISAAVELEQWLNQGHREELLKKARRKGVSHVRVVVKGLGPGRQAAISGLTMGGLEVISLTDNTPIPHNGCRPRKTHTATHLNLSSGTVWWMFRFITRGDQHCVIRTPDYKKAATLVVRTGIQAVTLGKDGSSKRDLPGLLETPKESREETDAGKSSFPRGLPT